MPAPGLCISSYSLCGAPTPKVVTCGIDRSPHTSRLPSILTVWPSSISTLAPAGRSLMPGPRTTGTVPLTRSSWASMAFRSRSQQRTRHTIGSTASFQRTTPATGVQLHWRCQWAIWGRLDMLAMTLTVPPSNRGKLPRFIVAHASRHSFQRPFWVSSWSPGAVSSMTQPRMSALGFPGSHSRVTVWLGST